MAPYSSTLAWKIPWTGKPGVLQSMGLQGVRPIWVTELNYVYCVLYSQLRVAHFLNVHFSTEVVSKLKCAIGFSKPHPTLGPKRVWCHKTGRTLKFSVRNLSFTLREMRRQGWVSGKRFYIWAFLVAHTVKNLPAIQKTQVWSMVQEDPLGKGMAIHSSTLAWRIPRTV